MAAVAPSTPPIQLKFDFKAGNYGMFFDRVFTKVERQQVRNLEKLAAWIRLVAIRSIKDSPKRASTRAKFIQGTRGEIYSQPGQPPLNKIGLLRQFIYYGYDTTTKSIVVGPQRLNKGSGAPAALEHGGAMMVRVNGSRWRQKSGGLWVRNPANVRMEKRAMQARPFMRPALEKSKQQKKFEEFWRNSLGNN